MHRFRIRAEIYGQLTIFLPGCEPEFCMKYLSRNEDCLNIIVPKGM